MEITIHQVAEMAKVSVSTASRILNGGTKGLRRDAAERAELVLEAARKLGYQPNQAARGLVMKRSFSIGFIATEMENPVRNRQVEALRIAALEKGYHLLVGSIRYGEKLDSVLDHFLAQRIDGLIFGNVQEFSPECAAKLRKSELPVVVFGGHKEPGYDSFVTDYLRMGESLTRHLIEEHNYKRIVFAGLPRNYPRREGYAQMMAAAGLAPAYWETETFTLAAGKELALRAGSLPDAVVCHNDLLAIGMMAGFRERKIRVPEDVALVGFDNIDMAEYYNPGLTTAGGLFEPGRELLDRLMQRIERSLTVPPQSIPCRQKLFVRESCGCAK